MREVIWDDLAIDADGQEVSKKTSSRTEEVRCREHKASGDMD
jgi:hypothetical protein